MKHIFLTLSLVFSLAGCTTFNAINGFSVTQKQLDAAQNTYDGTSLVSLDKYSALVTCKNGQSFTLQVPCHDKAILKKWRNIDKSVADAISSTQDMITSGNNTGAVAAWNVLQTALKSAKDISASSGASLL